MRVVVVDDHAMFADGVNRTLHLRLRCEMLAPITSMREALERLPREQPDLVVLDQRLEDGRGVELLRQLRNRLPQTRWLLVSAHTSASTVREALALGLHGAVAKGAGEAELVAAVRHVLAGEEYLCARTVRMLRELPVDKLLTGTERRILPLIAEGYEAKDIAALLGLAAKTVLNDMVAIRQKTGAQSMVQLAHYAENHGLVECR